MHGDSNATFQAAIKFTQQSQGSSRLQRFVTLVTQRSAVKFVTMFFDGFDTVARLVTARSFTIDVL